MPDIPNAAEKALYLADAARLREHEAPEWLRALRRKGEERFAELPFPHRKQEEWRFTNVNPIVREPFHSLVEQPNHRLTREQVEPFLYGEEDWIELVFIDGFFAPEMSRVDESDDVRAGSLLNAALEQDPAIGEHLGRYVNGTSDVFSALNTAFLLDGAAVRIGRNAVANRPIHLVHLTSPLGESIARHPRNLIVAEPHSESTIVESYGTLAGTQRTFTNAVTEISLADGARMNRIKILEDGPNAFHLSVTRVHQQHNSYFGAYGFSLGGRIGRNALSVELDGEGAECSLHGLYLTDDGQLVDNAIAIEHRVPRCTSRIGYKGVLDGRSQAVFSGKVYVHRGAQKTDSNQLNRNMLLSDKATVDTKPLLEIFADDVKCTHGATVGQPPREQIFYFQTRGISEAMAKGILTYGFADEVVTEVRVDAVRRRLEQHVFDRYSPK